MEFFFLIFCLIALFLGVSGAIEFIVKTIGLLVFIVIMLALGAGFQQGYTGL